MASFQVDSSKGDFSIYRTLLLAASVIIGISAQFILASGSTTSAIVMYALACVCAVLGVLPVSTEYRAEIRHDKQTIAPRRLVLVIIALLLGAGAFALSGGNLYRIESVILWLASILCWWLAWMQPGIKSPSAPVAPIMPPQNNPQEDGTLYPEARALSPISRLMPVAILIGILALGLAFRYYDLYNNPREMNSDQAEKLLDVNDVLNGAPHIFFERNTGREPWQFYWTVFLIKVFNLPVDFMALKLGTSFIGWLMLPAIFLLAREVFDTRTALIATLFAAVASWGVITARYGLRYPLAPCAVAWAMYFLVRGLRRNERNSMLAAGVSIGIGLQGYTAYRFMVVVAPFVVLAWVGWTWLHKQPSLSRASLTNGLLAMVMAVLVMMPLLRYGADHPDMLFYRSVTRLSSEEQPIPGNPVTIFADNVKNVLLMFNVTHDEVWVANLSDRPAMDNLLGGLLIIGAAGALTLSIKQRNIWPALILTSGVLMLLPSALSIAFPRENPSVVRTGGALPLLMIVCAVAPGNLLRNKHLTKTSSHAQPTTQGKATEQPAPLGYTKQISARNPVSFVTTAATILLCGAVIAVNYQRVFIDYPAEYCPRAQNASDIAREMDVWVSQGHARSSAWLVGYPYWVDTRAVGIFIGDINFPNAAGASVGLQDAASIDLHEQPGWFALNEEDAESVQALKRKYPQGRLKLVIGSQCSEKRFIVFTTN